MCNGVPSAPLRLRLLVGVIVLLLGFAVADDGRDTPRFVCGGLANAAAAALAAAVFATTDGCCCCCADSGVTATLFDAAPGGVGFPSTG